MINTQCLLVAIVTAFVAVVSVDVRDAFLPVIICMILLSGFFVFSVMFSVFNGKCLFLCLRLSICKATSRPE